MGPKPQSLPYDTDKTLSWTNSKKTTLQATLKYYRVNIPNRATKRTLYTEFYNFCHVKHQFSIIPSHRVQQITEYLDIVSPQQKTASQKRACTPNDDNHPSKKAPSNNSIIVTPTELPETQHDDGNDEMDEMDDQELENIMNPSVVFFGLF